MMTDVATQLMHKWERLNPGESVDAAENMTRLTLDTIALCGFGYRLNSFYRDTPHPFVDAMMRVLTETQTRGRQLAVQTRLRRGALRRLEADNRYMEHEVGRLIDERRRAGDADGRRDLLSCMLNGVDKRSGQRLPDDNIVAQCITFLVAGHETTSGLLSFAIALLLGHPEVVVRAEEEVDRILGTDTSEPPTYTQVQGLGYLTQILDETLRLWPTAPAFTRYPYRDTEVGGYLLPAGVSVTALTPMLHRLPDVWGPDAEKFDPDRFSPQARAELPPNAFKPFGSGQRACIGRQFAIQEAVLVLGMLLQRFRLVDHLGYRPTIRESLTLKPAGLRIQIQARPGRTPGARPAPVAAPARLSEPRQSAARLPDTADRHGTPLTVLFGSNLGTAEGVASRIAQDGTERGYAVTLAPLDDRTGDLPGSGALVVICASYNGQPPDNAEGFCAWLRSDSIPATPPRACPSRSSAAGTWTGRRRTKPCPRSSTLGSRRSAAAACTPAARVTPALTSMGSTPPGTPACGRRWPSGSASARRRPEPPLRGRGCASR